MVSVVRQSDLVWLPWKNGAGQMADAAMSAERTTAGDPVWRVSVAKVEHASAFSHFPDVERGMMLIEGERLDLHIDRDALLNVRAHGPAVTFAGDRPTRGVPCGGGITNLNVMVQRGALHQRMIRWHCAGTAWLPVMPGGQTFVYIERGQLALAADAHRVDVGDMVCADASILVDGAADLIEINIWKV